MSSQEWPSKEDIRARFVERTRENIANDPTFTRERLEQGLRQMHREIAEALDEEPGSFVERQIAMSLSIYDEAAGYERPLLVIDGPDHLTDAELGAVFGGEAFEASRRQVVLAHLIRGCASCREVVKSVDIEIVRPADPLAQTLADWLRVARGFADATDFQPVHGWTLRKLAESFDGRGFARAYVEAALSFQKAERSTSTALFDAEKDLMIIGESGAGRFEALRALANAYAAEVAEDVFESCLAADAAQTFLKALEDDETQDDPEIRATVYEIAAGLPSVEISAGRPRIESNRGQLSAEKCERALEQLRKADTLLEGVPVPGRRLENKVRTSITLMRAGRYEEAGSLLRVGRASSLYFEISHSLRVKFFYFLIYAECKTGRYEAALEVLKEITDLPMSAALRERMPFGLIDGLDYFRALPSLILGLETRVRELGYDCSLSRVVLEFWGDFLSVAHFKSEPRPFQDVTAAMSSSTGSELQVVEVLESLSKVKICNLVKACPKLVSDRITEQWTKEMRARAHKNLVLDAAKIETTIARLRESTHIFDTMNLLGAVLTSRTTMCLHRALEYAENIVGPEKRPLVMEAHFQSMFEAVRQGKGGDHLVAVVQGLAEMVMQKAQGSSVH